MQVDLQYIYSNVVPIIPNQTPVLVKPSFSNTYTGQISCGDTMFTSLDTPAVSGTLRFESGEEITIKQELGFTFSQSASKLLPCYLSFTVRSFLGRTTYTKSTFPPDFKLTFNYTAKARRPMSSIVDGEAFELFRYNWKDSSSVVHSAALGIVANGGRMVPFDLNGSAEDLNSLFDIPDYQVTSTITSNIVDVSNNLNHTYRNLTTDITYHYYGYQKYLISCVQHLNDIIDTTKDDLQEYVDVSVDDAKAELTDQYQQYIDEALTSSSKRFVSR